METEGNGGCSTTPLSSECTACGQYRPLVATEVRTAESSLSFPIPTGGYKVLNICGECVSQHIQGNLFATMDGNCINAQGKHPRQKVSDRGRPLPFGL